MKKVSTILVLVLLTIAFNGTAQTTAPADFFAGKWEITVSGTPNGESKLVAELVRKDGKLTGHLVNAADPKSEKIPATITEDGNRLAMGFVAQGYDVTIDLTKVDDDNLKGTLMDQFEAKAKRLKQE